MRTRSIDTLKGLAITAVMLIHTEPFLAVQTLKDDWYFLGQLIQQMACFAVPFFFATAGYFFSRGTGPENLSGRWWRYISRLSVILMIWVVIDGALWGGWLESICKARSLSPVFWNLGAIPSFAVKRPDLFVFRGTAVPLWFLVSLIASISLLTLSIKLSIRPGMILVIGFCGYFLSLATSFYADTLLGIGLTLPLEQRGPLIGFMFVSIGHYMAARQVAARSAGLLVAAAMVSVFAESAVLSSLAGLPFQERPYLFGTLALAAALLLFALRHPDFGAGGLLERLGQRSLGLYLVHTPVLGALGPVRDAFIHPLWELLFPAAVLAISYGIVGALMKLPYVRSAVS